MREKIAKELYRQHPQVHCDHPLEWKNYNWDELDDTSKDIYYERADCVLACIGTPDADVLKEIRELANERAVARGEKDFARSDLLRGKILKLGWRVKDVGDGFELEEV